MTQAGQSDSEVSVETIAVIHGLPGNIAVRKDGNDDPGLWIKAKPDGNGEIEIHLTYAELAAAFKVLGINRADLFPDG